MTSIEGYPKRLIEVDLPIKRISAHARREKSIRHGHISTLHIWWARRPLAACRAVLCAALWPDPLDEQCPQAFRDAAALALCHFAEQVRTDADLAALSAESWTRWKRTTPAAMRGDNPACWADMRLALLDFIADFANWDASTAPAFLEAARLLTHIAHLSLSDPAFRLPVLEKDGTLKAQVERVKVEIESLPRPLVVDPFAGGGAIPLEALRVGADTFASDLNPVAVLLNKVVLEYVPKYGQRLADEVRKWGQWIKEQAERELAEFYPKDPDGATPIAYLWARTIRCEGPGCGAEVPLIKSMWLARKGERSVALQLIPNRGANHVEFDIIVRRHDRWLSQSHPSARVENPRFDGTVARGSATCPLCGYTTPIASVREQLKLHRGGANDARLFCVVTARPRDSFRSYRLPMEHDHVAARVAAAELNHRKAMHQGQLPLVPTEPTPQGGGKGAGRAFSQRNYGMDTFEDLFTARQLLTLTTLGRLVCEAGKAAKEELGQEMATAVTSVLGLCASKLADLLNSLCSWQPSNDRATHLFARQAIQITWDFTESTGASDAVGNFGVSIANIARILDREAGKYHAGIVERASATQHPLPDDSADAIVTDPPYYDAVPYSDLSDFFYVWLRRALADLNLLSAEPLTPKQGECIVDEVKGQDAVYFEQTMTRALAESRRTARPTGIGVVVFAHKSTSGWEAQLQALVNAGWVITGSWPIDTEWETRLRAMNSAALASSVHLVCRPRETRSGTLDESAVGEWRNVLDQLPGRIHDWMPRLSQEGVVGADAIFACLGPALEIYSRYARVEKASGEWVTLKEYLEQVWAAVAREALTMIFEGADATGFEEDARLTAMWLWTLSTGGANGGSSSAGDADNDEDEDGGAKAPAKGGFYLEYDAARKIAQGLGAHLEQLGSVVEVKADKARLLPVAERSRALLEEEGPAVAPKRGGPEQLSFLTDAVGTTPGGHRAGLARSDITPGLTVLDRVHQAMLLFAASRGEALRRFLVDDGAGRDQRFWRLAQALSALYPSHSDEKRWVDGVLGRKKGLGF